jgi:HD-like signal output (HDOD) protein
MMLRLGELLIGQADPNMLQEIEQLPHQPGCRWERETRLTGFSEGQITAELARRWNFPMQMVQALQRSSEPLSEQAFSRLGSVVHLASLLADTPYSGPEMIDTLPQDVMDSFQVDVEWMRSEFPAEDSFLDLAAA